jgi:hypothetical protein
MVAIQALDTYLMITDDAFMKSTIESIKNEISNCKCPMGSKAPKSNNGKKREPSKYNLHTSSCMKTGRSMKECAIEWNNKKI